MTDESPDSRATLCLPARLTSAEADRLKAEFEAHRGQPLCLDAGAVGQLGGQCLQVLLAARRAWADDQAAFEMHNATEALRAALPILGVTAELIGLQEAES